MRKTLVILAIFTMMIVLVSCSVKAELGTGNDNGEVTPPAPVGETPAPAAASAEGPKVVVLQVGDAYDEESGEVTSKTTTFSPDSQSIHVNAGITGLETGATISGTLHVVEVKDTEGTIIRDMDVLTVDDKAPAEESTMHFEYTVPDNGWPVGDYVVNISVDGEQIDSVEIEVK